MTALARSRGVIPRCRRYRGGLVTERLRLVPLERLPGGVELRDGTLLASLLGTTVPEVWPPAALEEVGFRSSGLLVWFMILKGAGRRRPSLVGLCGFRDLPDESGAVELRYEVLPDYQRRGLATEGAEALVAWAFESRWARSIRAKTLRDELGAMEVLARLGFTLIGTDEAGQAYLFELEPSEGSEERADGPEPF